MSPSQGSVNANDVGQRMLVVRGEEHVYLLPTAGMSRRSS